MVEATETGLVDLYGVGPLVAGRVLAEVGDVGRFPTKDHFATYNGTAPLDVSSGDQVRHRLSRSGNRRVNHALHIMAITPIRNPKSEGRAYYNVKRAEGKTGKEALRCLKRRLSDVSFYRQLVADHYAKLVPCASPTTARPMPSTSSSPTRRSARADHPPGPDAPGVEAFIALDWKDDRLVGIEVLDADLGFLPADFLEQAEEVTFEVGNATSS